MGEDTLDAHYSSGLAWSDQVSAAKVQRSLEPLLPIKICDEVRFCRLDKTKRTKQASRESCRETAARSRNIRANRGTDEPQPWNESYGGTRPCRTSTYNVWQSLTHIDHSEEWGDTRLRTRGLNCPLYQSKRNVLDGTQTRGLWVPPSHRVHSTSTTPARAHLARTDSSGSTGSPESSLFTAVCTQSVLTVMPRLETCQKTRGMDAQHTLPSTSANPSLAAFATRSAAPRRLRNGAMPRCCAPRRRRTLYAELSH